MPRALLLIAGMGLVALASGARHEPVRAQELPRLDEDVPELARRCNAVALRQAATSMGLAGDDPVPLRAIGDELIARGPDAVDDVLTALEHSLYLRRIAPGVLAHHPSDRVRSALVTLLEDDDARTATRAADALGRVGGTEIIAPLVAALAPERPTVRHAALNALAALGAADRAVDEALVVLVRGTPPSRTSAAQLLAELRGSAHLERAAAALEHRGEVESRGDVRAAVRHALGIVTARRGSAAHGR